MTRQLALLLCVATFPLAAQISETIEVAVTSVDVVVTDGQGNRVRGLTKADFEILEDGKPREITNFSELALTPPAQAPATATIGRGESAQPVPPRRLMLVFDHTTLTPELRRSAVAAAQAFVDSTVRPADKVMIAVLAESFTPRTEWTSDKGELEAAIRKLATELTASAADAQRRHTEQEINALIDLAASTDDSDGVLKGAQPPSFEELVRRAQRYADEQLIDSRRTLALLGTVVTQFSVYPEKKALIVIGEGLDARPGADVFHRVEALRTAGPSNTGVRMMARKGLPGSSVIVESNKYNNTALLDELAANAFRKGVPIYAINPGTNADTERASGDLPDRTQEFARFASRSEGYQAIGDGSGGAAYIGMRADVALGQVAADIGGYYSLGFRAVGPPRRNSIVVRVRQPSHRVRLALAGAPPLPADDVSDAVTAHHVLEPESNDLDIMVETGDVSAAGEKQKVKVNVIIPIANLQLARQGSEVTGGFDVYLSISDGKGFFSPVNKQSHSIRWPAETVPEDEDRTLTYSIDVTLEPGTTQISVGVVDHASKKTGYDRITIGG